MTRDTEQQLAPSDVTLATIDKLRQIANEIERGERRVCSTIIEEAPERPVQTHTFVSKRIEHGLKPVGGFVTCPRCRTCYRMLDPHSCPEERLAPNPSKSPVALHSPTPNASPEGRFEDPTR